MSWNSRVTSSNLRVLSSNPRLMSLNPQVTSLNLRDASTISQVTNSKPPIASSTQVQELLNQ